MTTLVMATADLPMDPGNWIISADQARTGSKSFYTVIGNLGTTLAFNWQPQVLTELYWRYAFFNTASEVGLYARINTIITVLGEQSRDLTLRQGSNTGTVLHTVIGGVPLNTWVVIEVYFNATTIRFRYNGVQVYENTNLTINLTDLNSVQYTGNASSGSSRWTGHVDDIIVCTDKWPGMGGLHVFPPTGPGTLTDWQGTLPNLNTPAATAGTEHQFTIDDAPANTMIINRLGVGAKARVNGQGYGAIKPTLDGVPGDPHALSISPGYSHQYWPGVTINDFNNLEIGVESA